METDALGGNMKGLCPWSWFGTDLDPFGEVVQEAWDGER